MRVMEKCKIAPGFITSARNENSNKNEIHWKLFFPHQDSLQRRHSWGRAMGEQMQCSSQGKSWRIFQNRMVLQEVMSSQLIHFTVRRGHNCVLSLNHFSLMYLLSVSDLCLMFFMLNGYHCLCKIFTIAFRNLTFLFWWSHLMKFYQTVLQSQKKRSVQSWKHFYCDVICFHSSPLCSLQITSASSWHWSHFIECNVFDSVSVIERWVWLGNCD